MFKKTFLLAATALTLLTCSNLAAQDQDIILAVEDEQITKEDFESIFRKNNRDSVVTQTSLDEYMELFINFKLKVRAATELGMDTAAAFQKELDGYRKQLSRPYLIDSELLDDLIAEAYERKKNEVRASHILVKLSENPSPKDTLAAFNKIMGIKQEIDAGADFNKIAGEKSEDPSATSNAGDLGWFSVFNMVYPFEEAAYTTPVGEVSKPVRTRFGYHLVKVTDKREAQGEVLVAHIMVKAKPNQNEEAAANSKKKIDEIYALLTDGTEDFDDAAIKYSEDKSTSRKGGQLPWFGAGKMVEEFETVAFETPMGAYSQPFLTSYGWHIIKKVDEKPVPAFDNIRPELKRKISRDSRSESTRQSFLTKLKKEYKYTRENKCYKMLYEAADSSVYKGYVAVKKAKHLQKPLFSFAGQERTVGDFVDYLGTTKTRNLSKQPKVVLEEKYDNYVNQEILDYEDTQLEKKHNEFRLLMNEYHDGILLFELTDEKVWTKAVKDSAGLVNFYENHKDEFMWPDRAQADIYEFADKAEATKMIKLLAKEKSGGKQAKEQLNKDSQLNVSSRSGLFSKEDEPVLEKLEWKDGISEIIEHDGKFVVIHTKQIVPAGNKQLDEAKGVITAAYQTYLEEQWIEELRAKYNFTVNKDVLYTIK